MKLPGNLGHLTYCLNIHPAETWEECRAALTGPVAAVKARIAPDLTFEPPTLSGDALEDVVGYYKWTRGGLKGIDFGGSEINTGQPRAEP